MPSILSKHTSEPVYLATDEDHPYAPPHRVSIDKSDPSSQAPRGYFRNGSRPTDGVMKGKLMEGVFMGEPDGINGSLHSLPNGRASDSTGSQKRMNSKNDSNSSIKNGYATTTDSTAGSTDLTIGLPGSNGVEQVAPAQLNGDKSQSCAAKSSEHAQPSKSQRKGHGRAHSSSAPATHSPQASLTSDAEAAQMTSGPSMSPQDSVPPTNKPSQPALLQSTNLTAPGSSTTSLHPAAPRLHHRHTLEVPRVSTSRTSRDFSYPNTVSDGSESGRFSPSPRTPRASNQLVRGQTRSIHSDMYLDEVPQDGDMARWTETVRQKRASRRKKKEEEEDDRVVVGTKVDMNHVNWVTAYNMLTGIRFTVSRTNAKMDRELTDADFDARHKFSFDITGNELTPSAKYDFKFKDYAPWVFRHLRTKFKLDPADYLMSLTSKYILSELGSPGKSGSFFYFSRDYKYIIKTIHHAEHKLLRKILREYFAHIEKYPNTLISQFYGLHRVKIPYGRKIHFVVMNNLFPPHRDIHQTFDLKGSTIGRDFKEDDLERNPRATLKDLNWLRRNHHFEFGPGKKTLFVEQMKRDVALLQRLHIMDYSMLVGIHDLNKGNDEKLRDKTLQVFQPGGDGTPEPQVNMLTRTPSKLENARQARQLRQIIKKEKPVPMDKSTSKMPDEMLEERKEFIFYSDDGGFRATHEDGQPGEEIYYLGIIDCLTHYGFVKKAENLWKGLSNNKSQISPIPPESYGDRFVKFISGLTMTKEEAERESQQVDRPPRRELSFPISQRSTDRRSLDQRNATTTTTEANNSVIHKAEKQAHKTEKEGAVEDPQRDRTITSVRSPSAERTNGHAGATLPVVEEDGEAGSREESIRNEKAASRYSESLLDSQSPQQRQQQQQGQQQPKPPPPATRPPKNDRSSATDSQLPSVPSFNRLSMGFGSSSAASSPTAAEYAR